MSWALPGLYPDGLCGRPPSAPGLPEFAGLPKEPMAVGIDIGWRLGLPIR